MKDRPILFSGPMVRAILEGRKTQTRRVMKRLPPGDRPWNLEWSTRDGKESTPCWIATRGDEVVWDFGPVYGAPGDRLWVRETFYATAPCSYECGVGYRVDHPTGDLADGDGGYNFRSFSDEPVMAGEQWNWAQKNAGTERWKPAIFMPRWASRITLEITDVRVQRLQEITEEDAVAEGCRRPEEMTAQECDVWEGAEKVYFDALNQPLQQFCDLWDSINGKTYPWASNPWCWVLSFRNVAQEGGAL